MIREQAEALARKAKLELVEDDVTPSDEVISSVGARLVALVPERGTGGRGRG